MRPIGIMVLTPTMAALALAAAGASFEASAEEAPTDILAAKIRSQGYACDSPQGAERDVQASAADEAVWVLRCENASYRVRLIPDMAAKVEKLDKADDKSAGDQ